MMESRAVGELRHELNASQYFTFSFGAIVGVAWVVVLGSLLKEAGPLGTIVGFLLGGIASVFVGLCYAEITTMFPGAGGEVLYAYEIYGVRASFAAGWFLALAYVAIVVFEGLSIGWIAGTIVPGIEGPVLYQFG